MRHAAKLGLDGIFAEPEPPLPVVQRALHCWSFCDGWNPAALPLYDATYGVDDWELMLELLSELRTGIRR